MSTTTLVHMFRRRVNVFGINRTTCSRADLRGCGVLCSQRQKVPQKGDIVRFDSIRFVMSRFSVRSWCSRCVNISKRFGIDWMVCGIVAIRTRGRRCRKFFRITTAGQIETTGFAISRFWGREPTWFESLPRDLKIRVLADYRIQCDDPKTRKQKADKLKIERIRRRRGNK